jgi:mono/diheme cytochrome c family protein
VPALLKALQNSQADVRIVLAYMDEAKLRSLAEALPEVDFIIGGPTGQAISPVTVGNTTIMSATNKGKFLAQIDLVRDAKGLHKSSTQIAEVSSTLTENPIQLANLKDYYRALAQVDFSADEAGLVTPIADPQPGYAIAGSESCAKCHQADNSVWHSSKHSHAWEVLVAKTAQYDPSCQQCHTTGYGQPAGFVKVAQSPALVHVGCENCHGPSQAHVTNPRERTPFQAKEQCVRCHDHENSPAFQYEPYWAKVSHKGNRS